MQNEIDVSAQATRLSYRHLPGPILLVPLPGTVSATGFRPRPSSFANVERRFGISWSGQQAVVMQAPTL
jgi:hypothetical protein